MMRGNALDALRRAHMGAVRGRFEAADDSKLMQVVDARHMHDERNPTIERFQNYGHSAVPLPPEKNGPKGAESLSIFLDGNRAHPIVIAVDDRRHRPTKLKPGESTLYDDQGQRVYLSRDGIKIAGGDKKLPVTITVGNATYKIEDGKITLQVDHAYIVLTKDKVSLYDKEASDPVMLQSGPSSKIFGVA